MSDVGVQVASNLTEELRYEARLENAKNQMLSSVIIEKLVDLYKRMANLMKPFVFKTITVMLFVGVNELVNNSIGKLAHR